MFDSIGKYFKNFKRNVSLGVSTLLLGSVLYSQNIVTGSVQSVPSMAGSRSKVVFNDTLNHRKFGVVTEDGNYSIGLPSGKYVFSVEAVNNFINKKGVTVNSNLNLDTVQVIENLPITSKYHKNVLDVFRTIGPSNYNVRWPGNVIPVNPRNYSPTDPLSMPSDFRVDYDSTVSNVASRTNGKVVFRDVSFDSTGIVFIYPLSDNMPAPGVYGWTQENSFKGFAYDKTTCYISRDINGTSERRKKTFIRELSRAMGFVNRSLDPSFVMYRGSDAGSSTLHHDEVLSWMLKYSLKLGSDLTTHVDSVISSINYSPVRSGKLLDKSFLQDADFVPIDYLYNIFSDRDGDKLVFGASSSDLDFKISNDTLYARSKFARYGTSTFVVSALDPFGFMVLDSAKSVISHVNHAPYVSTPMSDLNIFEDSKNNFAGKFSVLYKDIDLDSLSLSANSSDLDFIVRNDSVLVTPKPLVDGVKSVVLTISDKEYSVYDTVKVNIQHTNHKPSIIHVVSPKNYDSLSASQPLVCTVTKSSDVDNDVLTYRFRIRRGNGYGDGIDTTFISPDTTLNINTSFLKRKLLYEFTANVTDGNAIVWAGAANKFVIKNALPTLPALTEPKQDTIKYVNGKLQVKYTPSKDSDKDLLTYIVNVNGNGLNTTKTTSDTTTTFDSTLFNPKLQYNISVKVTDGWDTVSTPVSKFYTPAITNINSLDDVLPKEFKLEQNYPNPFNPVTVIRYAVPARSRIRLSIHSVLGQVVFQRNEEADAGWYSMPWREDGASGMYIYLLEATSIDDAGKTFREVRKMVKLK